MKTELLVSHLASATTVSVLREVFAQHGPVESVRFTKVNGRAIVKMADPEQTSTALLATDGLIIDESTIRVRYSRFILRWAVYTEAGQAQPETEESKKVVETPELEGNTERADKGQKMNETPWFGRWWAILSALIIFAAMAFGSAVIANRISSKVLETRIDNLTTILSMHMTDFKDYQKTTSAKLDSIEEAVNYMRGVMDTQSSTGQ